MIPEAPSLHPRCHVIPDPPGLLVRRGGTTLRVTDAARAERLLGVLGVLDGRPAAAALSALGVAALGENIRILEELHAAGMLVETGQVGLLSATPNIPAVESLSGIPVAVTGQDIIAGLIAAEVIRAGARVVNQEDARVTIMCAEGPDLASLEAWNEDARKSSHAWMPAFQLGDHLIAGPVVEPARPGCFNCFMLRYMGMAESVPAERTYLSWIRNGGWHKESVSPVDTPVLVRLVLHAVSLWLSEPSQRVCLLDVETGELHRPRLVPHPACRVCGGCRRSPVSWSDWRIAKPGPPLEQFADRLESVVDDRIGLVGRITTVGSSGAVPLVAKVAQFASPCSGALKTESANSCGGLQPTDGLARLVAIVEGLERYCGVFPLSPEVVAPYEAVREHAVLPTSLPLFSDTQYGRPGFPFRRFRPDETLSWVWGYSLSRDAPRLVLKSAVTYGPTDDRLLDECSSGVAAGASPVEAVLRGLCERVERDAFMIFWLNRIPPPLLDLETLPEDGFAKAAAAEVRAAGYEPFAANITSDLGIPVFLGLAARSDGRYPALIAGAGCAFDATDAVDRAFREVLGAVRWGMEDPAWRLKPPMQRDEVKHIEDHHAAYSHPEWLPRASFLWSSARRQTLCDLPQAAGRVRTPARLLAEAVADLDRHGLEVIAVDLTTPDVAETGIRVVRAVIPGLQPIVFGRHVERLGGLRVFEAPCRMGYAAAPLREQDLNTDPHCFP